MARVRLLADTPYGQEGSVADLPSALAVELVGDGRARLIGSERKRRGGAERAVRDPSESRGGTGGDD